ncbi:MAG: hypothetical protein RLZZ524_630, partial [Pseudomonadota bacterium]
HLPRAVRAQMQRVNDRLAARSAVGSEQPPTPAPNPAPDGGAPAPTASATNDDPPRADLAPPADPASTAPSAAADPRENDPVYWKQRFKVTEGMLQSRSAEVRALGHQITELQEQIATLKAQSAAAAPSKPDLSAFFTPEQINNFGETQCEAMASAAMTAARQQAQALIEAEVKPIRDRAQQSAKQADDDAEAAFWAKLAELEPEYEDINARPEWLAWLAQPDETTGLVRQDILDRHRHARNAAGVAKVFQAFKGTHKRPTPPVSAPRSAGPAEAPPPAPAAAAKGYPTREEIREHYKRAATGKVTQAERDEFEARLRLKHAA